MVVQSIYNLNRGCKKFNCKNKWKNLIESGHHHPTRISRHLHYIESVEQSGAIHRTTGICLYRSLYLARTR